MLFVYFWILWSCLWCYFFHVAWWGSEKARTATPEFNAKYPWFTHPNLDKWNYWTMLLQSFTIFPIRAMIYVPTFIWCGVMHMSLGHVGEDSHIKRNISRFTMWWTCVLLCAVQGFQIV